MNDTEHTIHGKVIPLQKSLSSQLPADCKTARAEADSFYYKTATTHYPPDHGTQYANNPDCEFLDSRCLGKKSGTCYTRQDRYDCSYTGDLNRIGIEESIHCEGQPMQCMLGECQADITEADNSDFASAVSGLHAAKHIGVQQLLLLQFTLVPHPASTNQAAIKDRLGFSGTPRLFRRYTRNTTGTGST